MNERLIILKILRIKLIYYSLEKIQLSFIKILMLAIEQAVVEEGIESNHGNI